MYADEVVDGTKCRGQPGLPVHAIWAGMGEDLKTALEYSENTFDNIPCTGMPKVEELLFICRSSQ
jgi:hypothetical protein